VILEFSTPRLRVVRALYQAYFHYVLPRIGRLVSGHRTAYHYLPDRSRTFPSKRSSRKSWRMPIQQSNVDEPLVRSRGDSRRRASHQLDRSQVSLDNISQFLSAIDRAGEMARSERACESASRAMRDSESRYETARGREGHSTSRTSFSTTVSDPRIRWSSISSDPCGGCRSRSAWTISTMSGPALPKCSILKVPRASWESCRCSQRLLELGKFPPRVKGGKAACQEIVLKRRGCRSLEAADHHVLARGRRTVQSRCRW